MGSSFQAASISGAPASSSRLTSSFLDEACPRARRQRERFDEYLFCCFVHFIFRVACERSICVRVICRTAGFIQMARCACRRALVCGDGLRPAFAEVLAAGRRSLYPTPRPRRPKNPHFSKLTSNRCAISARASRGRLNASIQTFSVIVLMRSDSSMWHTNHQFHFAPRTSALPLVSPFVPRPQRPWQQIHL